MFKVKLHGSWKTENQGVMLVSLIQTGGGWPGEVITRCSILIKSLEVNKEENEAGVRIQVRREERAPRRGIAHVKPLRQEAETRTKEQKAGRWGCSILTSVSQNQHFDQCVTNSEWSGRRARSACVRSLDLTLRQVRSCWKVWSGNWRDLNLQPSKNSRGPPPTPGIL